MSNAVVEIASPVADTIFINGKVITVNSKDEIAEALATRGDRILRVGSRPYVEQTISHNTKVIDLTGRAMIPGLIDNHIHMTNSPQRHWADCTYSTSHRLQAFAEKIAERVRETKNECLTVREAIRVSTYNGGLHCI